MAVTFINSVSDATSSSDAATGEIDTATLAATLIVVAVGAAFAGTGPPTDYNHAGTGLGNTYTALTERASTGGTNSHLRLYYCSNPVTSTTHNWKRNDSGHYPTLIAMAFNGTLTSSDPFDVENGRNDWSAGSGTQSTGSVTPSLNNSLVVTAFMTEVGRVTSSITAGTSPDFIQVSPLAAAAGNWNAAGAYLLQGAAAATNPNWTYTSLGYGEPVIAVFKPGVAGPPVVYDLSVNFPKRDLLRPGMFQPGIAR